MTVTEARQLADQIMRAQGRKPRKPTATLADAFARVAEIEAQQFSEVRLAA